MEKARKKSQTLRMSADSAPNGSALRRGSVLALRPTRRRRGARTGVLAFGRRRLPSSANRVHRPHLPTGRPNPAGGAHGGEHAVVDVQALGADVNELARLEPAVG